MRQIKLLTDERNAESLADMLMDAGALSATIEDADAESVDEKPLYGEPGLEPTNRAWPRSILSVLAEDDFDIQTNLAIAAEAFNMGKIEILEDTPMEDADWVRITQAQFQPIQVSKRLWIVPTWHELPDENAINLRLDPGVAFGTGSHSTTHLCLQWLDEHVKKGDSVLDYGCGTGILGIAAKLVGAGAVLGTDIDPLAVEASDANAEMNEVEALFVKPHDMPEGKFDVVVANILRGPLVQLAPILLGRVAEKGSLVLSGILAEQADDIIAAYAKVDPSIRLSLWKQEEEWVCLAGQRI